LAFPKPGKQAAINGGITRMVAQSQFLCTQAGKSGRPSFSKIVRQLGISLEEFQELR
jgi:hypothetical protein